MSDEALKATVVAWENSGRKTVVAAKELGINESSMRKRLQQARVRFGSIDQVASSEPTVNGKGRSLEEFRGQHDKDYIVPKRLREALKVLGASGWEYEALFARLAGVGLADLANYRELFADYVVAVQRDGKRAWAGSPAMAAKMRAMVSS